MAEFAVPDKYAGKTLNQVAQEIQQGGGYVPRIDVIASNSGIDPNAPLTKGQVLSYPDDPGAGEYQFLSSNFGKYDAAKAAIDAANAEIKRETDFLKQYTVDNPFVFDENAARTSATAEYDPYYKTLLDEYTKGVEIQKEGVQGQRQLLTTLNKLDTEARSRNAAYAIENAQKGYAGQGLFFSGVQERGTGRLGIEANAANAEATARNTENMGGLNRQEANINLNQQVQNRQLNESRQGAIESGIQQRLTETQNPYYYNFTSAYKRQFPTGNQDVSAYLPADYLRY